MENDGYPLTNADFEFCLGHARDHAICRLPTEIVDLILSCLCKKDLKTLRCCFKDFNDLIVPVLFDCVYLAPSRKVSTSPRESLCCRLSVVSVSQNTNSRLSSGANMEIKSVFRQSWAFAKLG